MESNQDKYNFLHPHTPYRGEVKPENLVFNANLQEFAQQVSYICNLETAGKISPEYAYSQIKSLWKDIKRTRKQLGIPKKPLEEKQNDD